MHLLHVSGTVGPIFREVMAAAQSWKGGTPSQLQVMIPRGQNVVLVVADELHFIEHVQQILQSPKHAEYVRRAVRKWNE
jgi:hypothetical protein